MEQYKIWREQNLIYIEVVSSGRLITKHAKDTLITRASTDSEIFELQSAIQGASGISGNAGVHIDNILKENGNPYDLNEFVSWLERNTGRT